MTVLERRNHELEEQLASLREALNAAERERDLLREELSQTVGRIQSEEQREEQERHRLATAFSRVNRLIDERDHLRAVTDLADRVRCAWESEHGPSYDLADPIERSLAELMQGLVTVHTIYPPESGDKGGWAAESNGHCGANGNNGAPREKRRRS